MLLCKQIPKAQKGSQVIMSLMLLGSLLLKGARKTLVKLTTEVPV